MIHRRHFLWSIILLIGAISLTACGGGGGDDGTPAPAPTPTGTVTKLATLDGTQEIPAVTTTANGAGSLTVDSGTGAVSGSLTIIAAPATTVTAAHVHDAAAGNAVIIPLSDSGNGVWSVPASTVLTAAQISSFTAGTLYFNVHTTANTGGEIRGNINKTSATLYAHLTGAQETTPVTTSAEGTGTMTLAAGTGVVTGSLTIIVAPVTSVTAAHVHDAAAGNAVIIPLSDSGGGVWSIPDGTVLTAAQISSFLSGKLYFNVHTTANTGGEIRGNIVLVTAPAVTPAVVTKLAILDGTQEIPAVVTTANGSGSLTVDTGQRIAVGSLTILSAPATTVTAAHVHDAAAGNAVIIILTDSGGGVWSIPAGTVLSPAQVASFIAGSLYFNVHTTANTGGEIRGNIDKTTATLFAQLAAIPPVVTSATGTGSLTLEDLDTGAVSGSLTITVAPASAITAVHVHDAVVGEAIAAISLTDSGGGVWSIPANTLLTTAQAASFISGKLNFTVHTTANPGGEIRGNIIRIAP